MNNPYSPIAALILLVAFVLFLYYLFGQRVKMAIFRMKAPKRFRDIFRVDFDKEPALKNALQERVVNPMLTTLAQILRNANTKMDALNREAKLQCGDYSAFRKRYLQARYEQKNALEKFDLAREVARTLGFSTKPYSEYTYYT